MRCDSLFILFDLDVGLWNDQRLFIAVIKEGEKLTKEDFEPEVLDAAIIGAAQKVEHYEISGYGTACYYAKMLGEDKVHALLGETLDEEKNADEKLNVLAKEKVNQMAMAAH